MVHSFGYCETKVSILYCSAGIKGEKEVDVNETRKVVKTKDN
jgi:hypothetical protein